VGSAILFSRVPNFLNDDSSSAQIDDTGVIEPNPTATENRGYLSPNLKKGSNTHTSKKPLSLLKTYRRLKKYRSNMKCEGDSTIAKELTQKRQGTPSQGVKPYKIPFFASRSDRQWSSPVLGQTCIEIPEDLRLKGTEPTRTKIRTRDWQLTECDGKSLPPSVSSNWSHTQANTKTITSRMGPGSLFQPQLKRMHFHSPLVVTPDWGSSPRVLKNARVIGRNGKSYMITAFGSVVYKMIQMVKIAH